MPPEGRRKEGTRAQRGPYAGASVFGSFLGVCKKGLAVRAKPPAAVTAETDMSPIQKMQRLHRRHRGQASLLQKPPQKWICTPSKKCSAQTNVIAGNRASTGRSNRGAGDAEALTPVSTVEGLPDERQAGSTHSSQNNAAICARLDAWSLENMFCRWVFTVLSLMPRIWPISQLVLPRATQREISASRLDRMDNS